MTPRITLALLLLILGLVAVPAADPSNLPPGKVFRDELGGKEKKSRWVKNTGVTGYMKDLTVTLKAEDSITIMGTVAGEDRRMGIGLLDKDGKFIAGTHYLGRNEGLGGAKLVVNEVSASGTYTIRVVSNRGGAFTLKADYLDPNGGKPGAEGETEESVKADIDRLEKELAAKKARLQEIIGRKK